MSIENNIVLNIPFDEPAGSSIAYDFSSSRADGTVSNAEFVGGKQGNSILFGGEGYCDVEASPINFAQSFTILAWLKRTASPDGFSGKRVGLFVCWDDVNGLTEEWFELGEDWSYWSIVKEGSKIYLYIDTQLVKTLVLPAQPTGVAIIQDLYSTDYGYGQLDEVVVYNTALTQEEIADSISNVAQLAYSIDGVDLKDWDIYVSDSEGLLDRPKLKSPLTVSWDDYHGEVVDLDEKRLEVREITLTCFMKATGKLDFANKLNTFLDVFSRDGTQRLFVDIHPTKPLIYEVYASDSVAISKRWNDDLMVGTFSLKLREPDPVKRIVRHQRISDSTKTLTLNFDSSRMVMIYWGDGTQECVYGDGIELTHEYTTNGIYYVVIAGVIEKIENFTTNGIIVWNKL